VFFRQVLHEDLGCASYVIADEGAAVVVDPKWETEEYIALARNNGFEILHILETHNHADHVSGHGRLRAATGATIHVSADAGVAYECEPLVHGDEIVVGETRIVVIATQGHRPEHLSFLVEDGGRGDAPWLLLTGDFLFAGDVARPDLAVHPEEGARLLYSSLQRLVDLPDFVEVWPGHVGGSLCGGADMSEKPVSTLGFERRFNRYLAIRGERRFVVELTSHLTLQPPNFQRIVEINKGALLTERAPLEPRTPRQVEELISRGAVLIDGRAPFDFSNRHVPGSINVSMARPGAGTRAGWVVDPEADVVVTAHTDEDAVRLASMLEAVGFCNLRGILADGIDAWNAAGLEVASTPVIELPELARRLSALEVALVDVRDENEWLERHVPGSVHVPYRRFRNGTPSELLQLPNAVPLAVACSAGSRSSLAASLLSRGGARNILVVADGGISDLADYDVEFASGEP
jgi:hydroxyacylglutathione hydrolase